MRRVKRRWNIAATTTVSIYTVVEAASVEEARVLALAKPLPSLCHRCASNGGIEQWSLSGELDGELTILEGEEVSS